ncbi:P-loop containing nucleoside triphosphate hydrolase protein [Ilyonectria sp. MPI-CAGE-AT-0026]|nr:P-loop containing nucleoside triphosphate hydrolase protein [Ilyonectria sp. MPI-CAGE-AT-0026]
MGRVGYTPPPGHSRNDPNLRQNPRFSEQAAMHRIRDLSAELKALRKQVGIETPCDDNSQALSQEDQGASWRTIYRIRGRPYLGKPAWTHGGGGSIKLTASTPLRDIPNYLEHHPDIQFVVFKDFRSDSYSDESNDEYADLNYLEPPEASSESILLAPNTINPMLELVATYPDFQTIFPDFDFKKEVAAPYFVFFHMFLKWEENAFQLEEWDRWIVLSLFEYLKDTMIPVYRDALEHFEAGKTTQYHIPYLAKPGEIVVRFEPRPTAFMISSWAQMLGRYKEKDGRDKIQVKTRQSRTTDIKSGNAGRREEEGGFDDDREWALWTVTAWNWGFEDGGLVKHTETLELWVEAHCSSAFDINTLQWFPLRFADDETKKLLLDRGKSFWRCRERQFVGYAPPEDENNLETRMMIDFAMYTKLHPESNKFAGRRDRRGKRSLEIDVMSQDEPPDDGSINLFPSAVIGYNLRLKKWVDIDVDRIREVDWNKTAFESLAIDDATKHLVKALISTQLKSECSTDLISGKGNGLIMLLHGGPGTGKTFTAGNVAEFVEKPLYRVTCGDIGTKPEDVEKYLESVLLLGKTWGCVVLLDEADVFLEERSLQNLERNALVSIFLRVLEYYDGILILTSNRVGTFDQAFKSRIQLALHYEKLSRDQRFKIWSNFFTRLQDFGGKDINLSDLYDHIGELADYDMNGREIRNTITTARQLAQFDEKVLSHDQIKHVIEVASKFETYLKSVSGGVSDEQRLRDDGIR